MGCDHTPPRYRCAITPQRKNIPLKSDDRTVAFLNSELLQALISVLEEDRPTLRNEIRVHLTGRNNLFAINGHIDQAAAISALINSPFLTETD
jgi:hypothetical protein